MTERASPPLSDRTSGMRRRDFVRVAAGGIAAATLSSCAFPVGPEPFLGGAGSTGGETEPCPIGGNVRTPGRRRVSGVSWWEGVKRRFMPKQPMPSAWSSTAGCGP